MNVEKEQENRDEQAKSVDLKKEIKKEQERETYEGADRETNKENRKQ